MNYLIVVGKIAKAIAKAVPKGKSIKAIRNTTVNLGDDLAKVLPEFNHQPSEDLFNLIAQTKIQNKYLSDIFEKYQKVSNKLTDRFFEHNEGIQKLFTIYQKNGNEGLYEALIKKSHEMLSQNPINEAIKLKKASNNSLRQYWKEVCGINITTNPQTAKTESITDKLFKKVLQKKTYSQMRHANEGGMEIDLLGLNADVAQRIDAHGIAKESFKAQLETLHNFLTKGINKNKAFHTFPLGLKQEYQGAGAGLGAVEAYRDGSFIITSGLDKNLSNDGIQYVIVNHCFFDILADLQNAYPKVKFIKSVDAPQFFNNMK